MVTAPLERIQAFHVHMQQQCDLIERLAHRVEWRDLGEEARWLARRAIEFFDASVPIHHRDEEDHLFPALEHHVASLELNATRALTARLRREHGKLARRWLELRPEVLAIAEDRVSALSPEAVRRLSVECALHVGIEQGELLPLTRRSLDERVLARIGETLARRDAAAVNPAGRPRVAA